MINTSEIADMLKGPVVSVYTSFCENGDIDFPALKNYIDFVISAGSKALILTYGDSLYSTLTDKEVEAVTKATVEFAAKRALVVAADRMWWTGKEIEFADFARETGADMLMVLPPDWSSSCSPETLAAHYKAVSEHIPVMLVTGCFIPRSIEFGLQTIQLLLESENNVMAVKDDFCGKLGRRLGMLIEDRMAFLSGGVKEDFLDAMPYGCGGYLSVFMMFRPEIAWKFWNAIRSNDINAARGVIERFEIPFFKTITSLTGGFDAGVRATLEIFGIIKRWRRPPYYNLCDNEMETLSDFLNKCLHV